MRDLSAIDGHSIWTKLVTPRTVGARHHLWGLLRQTPAQRGAYKVRFGKQPSRFQFSRLVEGASV
jgi:hypothetical protein